MEDFTAVRRPPVGMQGTPINEGQSTHTASVHQTASASAKRLYDRYTGKMTPEMLHTMKMEMDALLGGLQNEAASLQNKAAKRCIERIERLAALGTPFTDPSSGVTLHDLLALSWLAIHDDTVRMGTKEDAIALWMEGLYEIQRGYNISAGRDSGGEDRPICLAGTFNKLLEKLQGVHPDVEILFITKSLASLKLPIVVQEEAIQYLREQADQSILCAVKEDGVESIWQDIRGKVSERMLDEFGSLYANEEDVDFDALMEHGKEVAFSEEEFQKAFRDFQEDNESGGMKP